jgi:hypothetical protein
MIVKMERFRDRDSIGAGGGQARSVEQGLLRCNHHQEIEDEDTEEWIPLRRNMRGWWRIGGGTLHFHDG